MNKLIKYCKPEYNPFTGSPTIRLGTLDYYRALDPSFSIADKDEGVETTLVKNFDNISSTAEMRATMSSLGVQHNPNSNIHYVNLRVESIFPNCYIWCCCLEQNPPSTEQGPKIDASYTSYYSVPNTIQFLRYMRFSLISNIQLSLFREGFRNFTLADFQQINLHIVHQPIRYVGEKFSEIGEVDFKNYAPSIPTPFRSVFVKPEKYRADNEYRFLFIFSHPDYGILPVRREPLDLQLYPFAKTNFTI